MTVVVGHLAQSIEAELLADGRVAVGFGDAAFEIGITIIDTRDVANSPGVCAPDDGQIGTAGDDMIQRFGTVDIARLLDNEVIATKQRFCAKILAQSAGTRAGSVA